MQFELHEFDFCESQASALRFIKFEILFVFRFALTRELCAAVTNDDFFLGRIFFSSIVMVRRLYIAQV